jgi:hypothetical protein
MVRVSGESPLGVVTAHSLALLHAYHVTVEARLYLLYSPQRPNKQQA